MPFLLSAQADRSKIIAKTNVAALEALSDKLESDFQSNRQAAYDKADLYGWSFYDEGPNGQITVLVGMDENENPIYHQTTNTNAALATRTNRVHVGGGAGLSLSGAGYTIGIWEAGGVPRDTHEQIDGRTNVINTGASATFHATHVAATLAGDGVGTGGNAANAKGMSPQATLEAYDSNSNGSEMATAAAAGMLVSNHSYGIPAGWSSSSGSWQWLGGAANLVAGGEDPSFGKYSSSARTWDVISYNAPYFLIVKSAGNDRNEGPSNGSSFTSGGSTLTYNSSIHPGSDGAYDCLSNYSNAKNILTVGAVNDVTNYNGPGSVNISNFSAFGPTDDGRIKPDIVANGVTLMSASNNSNTAYGSASGTSMSSPNVAGSAMLLQEHYENTHGAGNFMTSATLKALIIHTADPAIGPPGPDYRFGWGLMNTEAAAELITDDVSDAQIITENTLVKNNTHYVGIRSNGFVPLRATLVWTDRQGSAINNGVVDDPTSVLVNDLDMRIVNNSTMFMPYVLNPNSPAVNATTGDNAVDNVEQIEILSPTAGDYFLTVSHKGNLNPTQQDFCLIITGGTFINCPNYMYLNTPMSQVYDLEVSDKIEADNTILPGANVTYDAKNSITLEDGFMADQAADFQAFIDGCGNLLKEENEEEDK